jgi:hypothetical protein
MHHWEELARYEREGFDIIVDKTWEDIDVADLFDDTCCDIQDLRDKIDSYQLDWFMLRARVMLDGHELGSHIVGGFLYEDAREVLTDGMAEDLIYSAMEEAKLEARRLVGSLQRVIDAAAA